MSEIRKRKVLTIELKVEVISEIEKGRKLGDVCRTFGLSKSTVLTIMKNKAKIIEAYNRDESSVKRLRKSDHPELDSYLLLWYQQQRSLNVPINGPILQAKCEEFAKLSGKEDFVCSGGWIHRFKARHGIRFGKMREKSKDAPRPIVDITNWLQEVWPKLKEDYSENNIFDAKETGLFYKLLPDQTLKFQGEKCHSGEKSKERLTLFMCVNMNGSEKRKLLVIGEDEKPKCFKGVKHMPDVTYKSNKNSWMTPKLFEEELRQWDADLKRQQRKILLLVDNCPAHLHVSNLSQIRLEFIPYNTSGKLIQPLDQGLIRSFKTHYRKILISKILVALQKNEEATVSILDALKFSERAWNQVSSATIKNCFHHSGLSTANNPQEVDEVEGDIASLEFVSGIFTITKNCEFDIESYITVDNDLITNEALPEEYGEEDKREEKIENPPTLEEAISAANTLYKYLERSDLNREFLKDLQNISDALEKEHIKKMVQCKIEKD